MVRILSSIIERVRGSRLPIVSNVLNAKKLARTMTFQIEGPFKGPLTMRQKIFIVKQMLKNIPLQEIAVGKPVRCKTIMRERKEDDFCAQRDTDGHIELSFTLNRTINELYLTVVIYDETVIGVNYLLGKIEN